MPPGTGKKWGRRPTGSGEKPGFSRAALRQRACIPLLILTGCISSQSACRARSREAPHILRPQIPAPVFLITAFGAVGNGKTLNTGALQRAINACSAAGGGRVIVPSGRFLTGPIVLASRVELHLDRGAVLLMSNNPAVYTIRQNRFQNCIEADGCHDVALTGAGVIDGQGDLWWKHYVRSRNAPPSTPALPSRPYMVVFSHCSRVLIDGVTLRNSPSFHLAPEACQNVTISRIQITAPARSPNTDGIDPSGWDFLITRCLFDVGDDCIAIKPSAPGRPGRPSCGNILITHCRFLHGHGMSIGGQTPGGLKNLTVRDCTFDSTDVGIRMKANRGSGGLVENLTYENLRMRRVKIAILITSYYPHIPQHPAHDPIQPTSGSTPIWRHIRIDNVRAEGGKMAGEIIGLPEEPVSDVLLTNVRISAQTGMTIIHARNVRFVNSLIRVQQGVPLPIHDAQVSGQVVSRR